MPKTKWGEVVGDSDDDYSKELLRQVFYERLPVGNKVEDVIQERNPELWEKVCRILIEECDGCEKKYAIPPSCDGHASGPTHCRQLEEKSL